MRNAIHVQGCAAEWRLHRRPLDIGTTRGVRGGDLNLGATNLGAFFRISLPPTVELPAIGFRVARLLPSALAVPAMSPLGLLTLCACVGGFALWRLRGGGPGRSSEIASQL